MNRKIIFVDDEEAILELYQDMFEHTDYNIFTELHSIKALTTIQKEDIHVLFFDLKMPEMDGIQLCRNVKIRNPIAIIHAVTGYSSLFELATIREAGFDEYFTKPISTGNILTAADQAFEKLDRWTNH